MARDPDGMQTRCIRPLIDHDARVQIDREVAANPLYRTYRGSGLDINPVLALMRLVAFYS